MKLAPLIGIEVVAFLLILAEAYVFFNVVVPLGPIPHNLFEYTAYGLLKVVLIVGLVVVWFLVMIELTRVYTRSKLNLAPRPSS
jgi:hypothetical protein